VGKLKVEGKILRMCSFLFETHHSSYEASSAIFDYICHLTQVNVPTKQASAQFICPGGMEG